MLREGNVCFEINNTWKSTAFAIVLPYLFLNKEGDDITVSTKGDG